jgi:putative transposase
MTQDPDRPMYRWRELTSDQRQQTLDYRRSNRLPWHSPPHYQADTAYYLITAACYEHRHVLGVSDARMRAFEQQLVGTFTAHTLSLFAWNVLPNHYHALVAVLDVKRLLHVLGQLHGRTAYDWNGEDVRRGRKVWCNAAETAMNSEGHFWASLNYVLHNAVRHGYVPRWQEWPYSNAEQYLAQVGRELALRRWRAYPLFDYGNDWDPPDF